LKPVGLSKTLQMVENLRNGRIQSNRTNHFKGVVVEGTKEMSLHNDVKITSKSLKNNPALGEPDIIAAIRTLPGIYMTNDLIGGFYVRGGSPDQNMIMLDGCEVVNPFHMLGLFSTFNVWAMDERNKI